MKGREGEVEKIKVRSKYIDLTSLRSREGPGVSSWVIEFEIPAQGWKE